jgi:uncharacterized protein (TIGR02186 family)
MDWRPALFSSVVVVAMAAATAVTPAHAQTTEPPVETVEADVSTRSVSITSGYTGTEIIIFGTVENSRQPSAEAGTYDVVVVVEGTPAPVVVRKKARVGGLWVNADSIRFASFPSYYAIASTRPIDEFADPEVLNEKGIGFDQIRMVPAGRAYIGNPNPKEALEFREAVIRLKQRDGLYVTADHGVIFIGRSLFRSTITLPPNVPVGPLTARVYLLRDGELLSSYQSKVNMERAGLERFLHDAAFERPLLYGVATILLAALAGLVAAFAFQRATAT